MALWWLFYDIIARLHERIHPFRYHNVEYADLHEHFHEFYRRAGRGSTMLVEEEGGRGVTLRKWYYSDVYEPPVLMEVILTSDAPDRLGRKAAMAYLKERGVKVRYGTRRTVKWKKIYPFWARRKPTTQYKDILVCDCGGSAEEALRVTELVFFELEGVDRSSRFSVQVLGGMSPADDFIGASTPVGALFRIRVPAKPYKHWHGHRGLTYAVGCLVGKAAMRIHELLFPPRGPGDDLRP